MGLGPRASRPPDYDAEAFDVEAPLATIRWRAGRPPGSGTDTADLSPGEWWVESATLNAQPIDLVAPDKNLAAVQRPNGSLIQTTFVIITKKATNSSRFITPVGLTVQ